MPHPATTLHWRTEPKEPTALRALGPGTLLTLLVRPDPGGPVLATDPSAQYGLDLPEMARRARATGSVGDLTYLTLPAGDGTAWAGLPDRIALVGAGGGDPTSLRRAGAAVARAGAGHDELAVLLDGDPAQHGSLEDTGIGALAEGILLGGYRPPFRGRGEGPTAPVGRVTLIGARPEPVDVLNAARIGAQTTLLARRLAATPSNIKNPQWMAQQAQESVSGTPRVTVRVCDERWLADQGMGGILAVGSGSATPPRLVTVSYTPPRRQALSTEPVVLVGKGITYDTGGISLKPREAMVPMKTDMSGAAIVLAAVLGAARAQVRRPVVAVLPLAENALGAESYRPGDVLRMWDGSTVEIANTDAEGRLVLADAMAWALAEYRPSALVDVATLTGAATLGLGKKHGALFSTDSALGSALQEAGEVAGEPLWPMPLVADYRHALDSAVADVCHVNTDPHTSGGAITAALFLQRFAGDVPWAHLDVAGPGRAPKNEHEIAEGPTGFSARALVRWLVRLDDA